MGYSLWYFHKQDIFWVCRNLWWHNNLIHIFRFTSFGNPSDWFQHFSIQIYTDLSHRFWAVSAIWVKRRKRSISEYISKTLNSFPIFPFVVGGIINLISTYLLSLTSSMLVHNSSWAIDMMTRYTVCARIAKKKRERGNPVKNSGKILVEVFPEMFVRVGGMQTSGKLVWTELPPQNLTSVNPFVNFII